MCGICGFDSHSVDEDVLLRMNERLRARGPDEAGHCLQGRAALAMRRLRVIDLQGGSQPMTNEDGTIRLVFNGEIYNYRELRSLLRDRGHRFASSSDTEVIVHGYEEWGDAVTDHLNGMFAFAVHDGRDNSWFLARDRMGQKPLYYHHAPDFFCFASQPAALLEHPRVRRSIDAPALGQYLAFEYVPAPRSLFQDIWKLPPGHRMRVRGPEVAVERYWRIPPRSEVEDEIPADGDDASWVRTLRARLSTAVERQLVADVPLGCFLSGGLDSSAVAVLMAEQLPPGRLMTFAIGFSERSFDESSHAQMVARHVGADHHVQLVDAQSLINLLPEVAEFMDEPLGDGSVLPTFALARFAHGHVTVALSGDGGDELLGGYPTLFADTWAERYARAVPRRMHAALVGAAAMIPVSLADMSLDFKVRQFLRGAPYPADLRHFAWVGSFLPEEMAALLQPAMREQVMHESPYAPVAVEMADSPRRVGLERLLYLYARFYLADDVLVKVDRATMACGFEARSPFLDTDFVRFCAALPDHLKIQGRRTKVALRRAFARDLPPSILARPKKGFGMPVGRWLRGPLQPMLLDLLGEARLRRQGIFEPRVVQRMCADHIDGRTDYRKQLWTLLAFQLWYDHHLDRR